MSAGYLSSKPSLTQIPLFKLWSKEVKNFPQLTLRFIVVVFESFSFIIVLINVDSEDVLPGMEPRSILKKVFMTCLKYKVFKSAVGGNNCVIFI